ncbi:MAG: tetratricopeptide repeat protein [Caldilineaceae bacterium]
MASPSTLTFGTLLRQLRRRVGMTQGDLASAVGYSVSFISSLEQNTRQPDVHSIVQHFVPALGLQEEPQLAARLLELAAAMRGDLAPATLTLTHETRTVLTETVDEPAHSLPVPPTLLIGREQEVKLLCNRMSGHGGRLLTLVGPPGIGKTRLGLEVATQLHARYRDGACFVSLAAVGEPEQLPSAILTALGVTESSSKPPQTRLIEVLRRKEILLLLDNFEQIVAAGSLVAQLLEACPGLHVLVTSRERLHLRAEQRFPVPPLQVAAALELFVQRAQAVEPDFELTLANQPVIEKICQRLDCLPLAIELIAARIDLYSVQGMLARIGERALDLLTNNAQDAPLHQRTLRQAIQYSYSALDEVERCLFRELGIFVDGFDLAAVVYFGFTPEPLQSLINKSLVKVAAPSFSTVLGKNPEPRYLLLEMLREYALEQLQVHNEVPKTKAKHVAYCLQLVEHSDPMVRSAEFGSWLHHLEREHNNLRAALTWTIAQQDGTMALRLCSMLDWFWAWHGHSQEGKRWLEQSFALSAEVPQIIRAQALGAAGHMEHVLGNHAQAQVWVEESLAIYQSLNDQRNVAEKSLQLGGILRKQHRYEQARFFYEQSFRLFESLEERGRLNAVHVGLGNLAMNQNDYQQARIHYEQALIGQRAAGEKSGMIEVLPRLAELAFQQSDYMRSNAYCQELLTLCQELGDQEGLVFAYIQLVRLALQQDEVPQASHYLTQSQTLVQTLGYPPLTASVLTHQGKVALVQNDWTHAHQCFCQSLQITHQLVDPLETANALENLANLCYSQADLEKATCLLGAAENLRQKIGSSLPPKDHADHQQFIAALRTQLDETTYARLYNEGFVMTTDQAVAFALA